MRAVRQGRVSLPLPRSPGTLPSTAPGSPTLALPRSCGTPAVSCGSVQPDTVPMGLAQTPWVQARPMTAPTSDASRPSSGSLRRLLCCPQNSVCLLGWQMGTKDTAQMEEVPGQDVGDGGLPQTPAHVQQPGSSRKLVPEGSSQRLRYLGSCQTRPSAPLPSQRPGWSCKFSPHHVAGSSGDQPLLWVPGGSPPPLTHLRAGDRKSVV